MKKYDMSFSQWRKWETCPAAAFAQYRLHEYEPAKTAAMAVGALVDAKVTQPEREAEVLGDFAEFFQTSKGEPNAACRKACAYAEKVNEHALVRAFMTGAQTQVELVGQLGGVTWLAVLDMLDVGHGLIGELKTTRDVNARAYVPRIGQYGSWIAQWGYGYQLALYRELVRQHYDTPEGGWLCVLLAVGKHRLEDGTDYPDIMPYQWSSTDQLDRYAEHMAYTLSHEHDRWDGTFGKMPPVMEMKQQSSIDGLYRCEKCDWCITTRQAMKVVPYRDPEPQYTRLAI
jgi:hypothetical protein